MNRDAGDWPVLLSMKGWRPADLGGDVAAALTLIAIAIPEQMATARLGAFPPAFGFWVFVAGSLGVALFSASRVLSVGADSTIAPIFAGGLAAFAAVGTGPYHGLAALLALMVGVLVLTSGLFRLGWIANLLSVPVTTGFLIGIAAHIVVSQLPAFLGLALPRMDFFATLAAVGAEARAINPYAFAIAVFVFAVTTIAERIDRRFPAAVVAVGIATLAVAGFDLARRGVPVLGALPAGLPAFAMPAVDLATLVKLIPLAVLVWFVVLIQTAATERAFTSSRRADLNRDYVGIGVANLLLGFIGAFPANASPPRTAAVVESGSRSGLCNVLAALAVALFAIFGMRLLADVPVSALAGLLFFVAQRIVRVPVLLETWRKTKGEFGLIVATAAAIVAFPIATGVGIGIGLSILHGVWTITRAGAVLFVRVPHTTIWWPRSAAPRGETVPGVAVIGFQAPLFFLNADAFQGQFERLLRDTPSTLVVLEASNIVEIDFSGAEALAGVIADLKAQGRIFAIARLESDRTRAALERFGITALIGEGQIYLSVEDAVRAWQAKQGGAA